MTAEHNGHRCDGTSLKLASRRFNSAIAPSLQKFGERKNLFQCQCNGNDLAYNCLAGKHLLTQSDRRPQWANWQKMELVTLTVVVLVSHSDVTVGQHQWWAVSAFSDKWWWRWWAWWWWRWRVYEDGEKGETIWKKCRMCQKTIIDTISSRWWCNSQWLQCFNAVETIWQNVEHM